MAIDTSAGGVAELTVVAALKNGLLSVYSDNNPSAAEMEKLARAIAPGIIAALQHIKDYADVVGVTAGSQTVTGGVD